MRPGTSDTWLKAGFFAALWVVSSYAALLGIAVFFSIFDVPGVTRVVRIVLPIAFIFWIYVGSGVAGRLHDSSRMRRLVFLGMWAVALVCVVSIVTGVV